MSKSSIEILHHIYKEASFICQYADGVPLSELEDNELLKRAIVRSLEIIGEASKKIDDEFKYQHPQIEWKSMSKMRDKLIHHYFGIDYEIVLNVISTKIPELKFQLELILGENKL